MGESRTEPTRSRWTPGRRAAVGVAILAAGLAAQTALEAGYSTPRPPLLQPLASLPTRLGDWVGRDEPMDPEILRATQCDEYVNRSYVHPDRPGRPLRLWINYSREGLNLRHSPAVCLPSGGWTEVESRTRAMNVERPDGGTLPIMRLGYEQADVVQGVGFWYYIFGEGRLEHFARGLPISSRSSHGRTTRGSGLTVEVFCPGASDPDGEALRGFAAELLRGLDPILPADRAEYYVP